MLRSGYPMFGKFFASAFTGSMMGAGPVVFAVWAYALANSSQDGEVELNPRLLAILIGTLEADVQTAIDYLLEEDNRSRSKAHDGRRLLKLGEFSYSIVNHAAYRGIANEAERRTYLKHKKREERCQHLSTSVNNGQHLSTMSTHTEAEAEVESDTDTKAKIKKKRTAAPQRKQAVALIDFPVIWSEARKESHYGKPWFIPKNSPQEKKLLGVATTIQEQCPHAADQTFFATCEKYFACDDQFVVSTKHCLELFCARFNQFLTFMPKVEYTSDGSTILKAGYTGSGKWVEPKALVQSQLLQGVKCGN